MVQFAINSDYVIVPVLLAIGAYLIVLSNRIQVPWLRDRLKAPRMIGLAVVLFAITTSLRHVALLWLPKQASPQMLFLGLEALCLLGAIVAIVAAAGRIRTHADPPKV